MAAMAKLEVWRPHPPLPFLSNLQLSRKQLAAHQEKNKRKVAPSKMKQQSTLVSLQSLWYQEM